MRIFIGMETSGQIRNRFAARGHDVISCDLLPADDVPIYGLNRHLVGDVFLMLDRLRGAGWWPDLAIFHPDCTYLTSSAEWAYADPDFDRYPDVGYHLRVKPETLVGADRRAARAAAVRDWERIDALPVQQKIAENPARGALSTCFRKPDQTIHPHQFGDDASKATGLWLWGVDPIPLDARLFVAPRIVEGLPRWANQTDTGQNRMSPGEDRWKDRSRTYDGIADAITGHFPPAWEMRAAA